MDVDGNVIGNVIGNVMVIVPLIVAALVSGNAPVIVIDLPWTRNQPADGSCRLLGPS